MPLITLKGKKMPQQFMLRKNAKFIFYQTTLGVTRIINFNQVDIHLTKYCIFVHNTRAEAVPNDIILSSTKKKCPKIGEQGIFFLSDLSFLETSLRQIMKF